jgi:hypothetical protein
MHFPRFTLLLFTFLVVWCAETQANPVISEFMADNETGIKDENGIVRDWIEIHNPTAAPIDLTNWKLADSGSVWTFPAVTLAPGEFLIVWASGQNRRVPGQPLHTNFSLRAEGEYLALLRPDGTAEQEFLPEYPPQAPDESYGLNFNGTPLVISGTAARFIVPGDDALGTTWTASGFNDGAWTNGVTGIGFGLMVPGITVRSVKKNQSFGGLSTIAETDALLALPAGSPQILADVTVVAATVNYLGEGEDGHYGSNLPFPSGGPDYHCIKATGVIQIPTSGQWTFGLNSDDGGRIRIDGSNVMVDDTNHGPGDHFGTVTLAAGQHTFEVIMWEQAGGDEVEFFAAPGALSSWSASFKLVGDTANGGLAAFTTPGAAGGGGVITTNIQSTMRNINSAAYVRIPFTASNVSGFNSLTLNMRYNDGYVAYLNGVEIARRNAPAGTPAYNATATGPGVPRTNEQSLTVEPVNVTANLPTLINGSNVLAIQGLNVSAADDSFLVLPELTGGGLLGGTAAFFDKPTPGSINGAPASFGKVADTQFSHTRGFYSAPFALTISTLTPDAQIRYTTNGSPPTATTGTVYTGPITVNSTRVIRAAAFKAGWEPTNVDTQTYLFVDDIVTQSPNGEVPPGFAPTGTNGQTLNYGMDPQVVNSTNANIGGQPVIKAALQAIPTISLVTDSANLFSTSSGIYVNPGGRGFAWERPCSIELINDPAGGFQVDAGVRIRGGFSRSGDNPKHAFHFFFRAEYGAGKLKYPLFGHEGVDEFDQIDLRTSQNYSWSFGGDSNNTFLREEFTRDAQGAMGQPYARGRYYHLYVNGQYWGLFDTEERTEASYSASYFGGNKDDYDVVKCEQTNGYTVGPTDGNLNAWQDLWNKARAHAASPTNANYFKMMGLAADGVTRTADPVLLDVDNLIDYMLLTFWTSNEDGATSSFLGNDRANNWFASRNRTGTRGFAFFAHDFEHSFGLPGSGLNGDRTGPYISPNQSNFVYSNPMFLHQDLMGNIEYKLRFADRVQRHMFHGGVLTPARVQALINKNAAIVENVIPAESARWGDSKREPALTRVEWRNARDYLLNTYAPGRGSIVLGQLRNDGLYPSLDAPTMSPFGGYITSGSEVVMSGPGTIYYTLDGTDPRLLGGGLNPNAQVYTSATSTEVLIPLGSTWRYLDNGSNQGTNWRARTFDDSTWKSGAAELGYGDSPADEATRVEDNATPGYVGSDTNRYATTYFRKTFSVTNISGITSLTVKVEYDDAAVVYINGTEAGRTPNIGSNPAFNFYTNAAIEDTVLDIPVNPALLVEGSNTVAVEVHQASAGSTDVSFNLSLTGTRAQTATPLLLTGTGEKRLRVRAQTGAVWSALDDALFLIDTVPAGISNLAITEIMYHPAPPTPAEIAAGFDDADLFEFVELTNISNTAIDLDGVYFGAGISFDFRNSALGRVLAPGARILVVANKAAFQQRYGTGQPIAGEFSGTLDNGGELLTLFTAADATLRTLSYDDVAPWPPETDGAGYSLVLRRPQSNPDPSIAGNWRTSTAIGGSPGGSDAQTYAAWKAANNVTDDAADNDRDGLTAFLEYVLGGTIGVIDTPRLPRVGTVQIDAGGGVLQTYGTVTFSRRLGADDVNYLVETSDILGSWLPNGVFMSATRASDGTESCVFRTAQPVTPADSEFMRLRATLSP